jgi:hypothetical protein
VSDPNPNDPLDFIVDRQDWKNCRFVAGSVPIRLEAGQVVLRVDCFALTSNNITYAAAGDMLGYWNFFPTEQGWGRIPAFGFADVLFSNSPQVSQGERYFGYFPMSRHLTVQADQAGPESFVDVSAHRSEMSIFYNTYRRVDNDPFYSESGEDRQILLSPLFLTSYLIDDFLAEHELFGAKSFVIGSASSKTAVALAHELSRNARGEVVGLTSPGNAGFVADVGYYDKVVLYDDLESLDASVPTVFIDMSGDAGVVARIHRHFGENLKHSCAVGITHWDKYGSTEGLPGPVPELFFAPAQAEKRMAGWGAEEYGRRISEAWHRFRESSESWLQVEHGYGTEAVQAAYLATLAGQSAPTQGRVLSLWDENRKSS